MIFGLFQKSEEKLASNQLDNFVGMLRDIQSSDLGLTCALVEHFANSYVIVGKDFYDPDNLMKTKPETLGWAIQEIHRLQASGLSVVASGWMVWAHTFRATKFPNLRTKAKEMWVLLSEGFPFAHKHTETLVSVIGFALNVDRPDRFPKGFEPNA
jgi:hypothetical protein